MKKIFSTLGLKFPNLIVSIDKTDGNSIEGEKGGTKLEHCTSFDDVEVTQTEQVSKTNRLLIKSNSSVMIRHTRTDIVDN